MITLRINAQVFECQEDLMTHAQEIIIMSERGRQRKGQGAIIRLKLNVVARVTKELRKEKV